MTDYKGWCRGLKKAGYATNKKYATLLIEMVERYDLNRFVLVHKSNNTKRRNKLKKSIKIKDDSENRRNSRLEVEGNDDFEISVGKGLSQIKKSANWINYIEVKKGDTLVILEAMKMEHQVKAPEDGKITKVLIKKDDQLENGALLMVLDN